MLRQEAEVQPQSANNEDRLNVDELLRYLAEMQARLDTQQAQIGALLRKNSELESQLASTNQAVDRERELRTREIEAARVVTQKQVQKAAEDASPVNQALREAEEAKKIVWTVSDAELLSKGLLTTQWESYRKAARQAYHDGIEERHRQETKAFNISVWPDLKGVGCGTMNSDQSKRHWDLYRKHDAENKALRALKSTWCKDFPK